MVKATKDYRNIFIEADWLKTTGVISGVPALSGPSSPRPIKQHVKLKNKFLSYHLLLRLTLHCLFIKENI